MADVFISYSRKDIAFARILHAALMERKLDTWIDWQDIPPTVDWLAEVYSAIEAADAFVFIVSATSVSSEICSLELAHALKNHKRLVPIILPGVDPKTVPQPISSLNWIFFPKQANKEFQRAFDILLKAIETDLDWVKEHTRLQVRALEWINSQRNGSLALRGSELETAEHWLSSSGEKEPKPTSEQTEFILASRQNATHQLRTRTFAITIALVVTITLAAWAFYQQGKATQQANARATAEANAIEQRDVAIARQLAAQALSERDPNYDLSLLLGLEALRRNDIFETRNSLLSVLQYSPYLSTILHGHTASIQSLAISPTGQILASADNDRNFLLWDVTDPERPRQLGRLLADREQGVISVSFSSDGKILASAHGGEVMLWNISDPSSTKLIGQPIAVPDAAVTRVAFSPTENLLATTGIGRFSLWNVSPESVSQVSENRLGTDFACLSFSQAFRPDGKILAIGCIDLILSEAKDYNLFLWDISNPSSPKVIGRARSGQNTYITAEAFNRDGKILASAADDGTIILWDTSNPSAPRAFGQPIKTGIDYPSSVTFNHNSKLLAVAGIKDTRIYLWDITNPESPKPLSPLLGHSMLGVNELKFHPEKDFLFSGGDDNKIMIWNLPTSDGETIKPLGRSLTGHTDNYQGMDFSPDGKTLAAIDCVAFDDLGSCQQGEIHLWNVTNLNSPHLIGTAKTPDIGRDWNCLAYSPDAKFLAVGRPYGTTTLWKVTIPGSPLQLGHTEQAADGFCDSAISADGKILASGVAVSDFEDSIFIWDVRDLMHPNLLSQTQTAGSPIVRTHAFGPDGRIMASIDLLSESLGDAVILWDVSDPRDPKQLGQPLTVRNGVGTVVFSPNGRILAIGEDSGEITLWDISNPRSPMSLGHPLVGHKASVIGLSFNREGTLLASGASDRFLHENKVRLWDVSNPAAPELFDVSLVGTTVEFNPAENILASNSDGTVILWDVSLESWKALACKKAGRNFTQTEWQKYLGNEPYRATCPNLPIGLEPTPISPP